MGNFWETQKFPPLSKFSFYENWTYHNEILTFRQNWGRSILSHRANPLLITKATIWYEGDGYTKKASRSEPPKQDGCTNRHVAKAASSHINDWSAQKQHLELAKPFRARERVIGLVWNKQNLNQIRDPEGKKCQKRKMVRNQNIYQWGLDFLFKLLVLTIHFLLLGFEIFLSSSSFMCRGKFQL